MAEEVLLKSDRRLEQEWRRAARYGMNLGVAVGVIEGRRGGDTVEDTVEYVGKGVYVVYLPDTPLEVECERL